MNKPLVYVARRIPEKAFHILEPCCEIRLHTGELPPKRDELLGGVAGCTGILSLLSDRIDAEVCDAAGSQLCVVSNFAVGFNNIDLAELRRRGIAIGNTPDVLTDATADIAVALLLAVARRIGQARDDVLQGKWKTWEPLGWIGLDLVAAPFSTDGKPKRLGVIGMGRIGKAVAKRLHGGWGMEVVYTSRTSKQDVDQELSARRVDLEELLESSDFVSLHVPLTAETEKLIGTAELELMKPTSILINTSRGEVVDQQALVDALRRRQLFGAGLDVCTPEPIPAGHPLLALNNCVLLPHIGSATSAARNAMAERAAQNIVAGIRQDPLPYPVQ